jgi:hemerythrin-like metal-binding protein
MSDSTINCPFCHAWITLENGKVKEDNGQDQPPNDKQPPEETPYFEAHVKPALEWTNEYALGIEDIDNQHRKIVDTINKISKSTKTGHRDQKLIKDILSELSNYVKEHFSFEEQLFMSTEYPDRIRHEQRHKRFTKEVIDLYHLSKTTFVDLRPILGFLTGWFTDHIQGIDRQYLQYIDQDLLKK